MDLQALADRPWFIVFSYVFSFGPWAILFAVDFISPRWRSIRTTRRSGIAHLIFSIFPLGVAIFYLLAQQAKGDYKEMMAACVAACLALYHIWRTILGLIQLQAYKSWCTKSLAWLRKHDLEDRVRRLPLPRCHFGLGFLIPKLGSSNWDLESDIDTFMLVNNQVIDNELFNSELPIRFSWWNMYSADLVRCTLRWTIAVLSHYGRTFLHKKNPKKYPIATLNLHLPFNVTTPKYFHDVLRTQENLLTADKLFYDPAAFYEDGDTLSENSEEGSETGCLMKALRNIDMKQVLLFLAAVSKDSRTQDITMERPNDPEVGRTDTENPASIEKTHDPTSEAQVPDTSLPARA